MAHRKDIRSGEGPCAVYLDMAAGAVRIDRWNVGVFRTWAMSAIRERVEIHSKGRRHRHRVCIGEEQFLRPYYK